MRTQINRMKSVKFRVQIVREHVFTMNCDYVLYCESKNSSQMFVYSNSNENRRVSIDLRFSLSLFLIGVLWAFSFITICIVMIVIVLRLRASKMIVRIGNDNDDGGDDDVGNVDEKKTGWRSCLAHQKHMLHERLINRQLHHIEPGVCLCVCVCVLVCSML